MEVDASPTVELVQSLRSDASGFHRQWINWLGLGGGGGVVALLSFAANLPAPDHALRMIWPALAAFIGTVVAAAITLLLAARENMEKAEHFAQAHNRDEHRRAAESFPLVIAAPQELADRSNRKRNHHLKMSEQAHEIAERSWTLHVRWRWGRRATISLACAGFVFGAAYPLYLIISGARLVPVEAERSAKR